VCIPFHPSLPLRVEQSEHILVFCACWLDLLTLSLLQSTFTALNIEYDNVSEQSIDDTQELQIEEALKLYQEALKYHSEGPRSYDKALDAYEALFQSEIFKYPESQSELRRSEDLASLPEYEELWVQNHEAGPVQLVVPSENAPNTLPQILHLSYKNHGQFLLDLLQYNVQKHLRDHPPTPLNPREIKDTARLPLEYYSEALDKDDSDVDLWRSTATVAELVGSNRITRFCLEAVLDMGEESLEDALGLVGVQETIALQRLKELSENMQDDLALAMAPLSNFRRKKLAHALLKRLESHLTIPRPSFDSTAYSIYGHLGRPPTRYVITATRRDWAAVGDVILQQLHLEQGGLVDVGPGVGVGLKIPDLPADEEPAAEPPAQEAEAVEVESPRELEQTISEPRAKEPTPPPADNAPEQPSPTEAEDVQLELPEVPKSPQDSLSAEKDLAKGENNDDGKENGEGEGEDDTPNAASMETREPTEPPSRKRSIDSAGLAEAADGGRVRSKRIRARETLDGANVEGASVDPAKAIDDSLQHFISADEWLFETINTTFEKLDAEGMGLPHTLRNALKGDHTKAVESDNSVIVATRDLYYVAQTCTPDMASTLANGVLGESIDTLSAISRDAGMNAFLGHTKFQDSQACAKPVLGATEGLITWLEEINVPWTYNKDAAWHFLLALLQPGSFPDKEQTSPSSYIMHRWSDDLKRIVVQIAVRFDDHIYPLVEDLASNISNKTLLARSGGQSFSLTQEDLSSIDMIQTLFELHLDVYSLIKHPASAVDIVTQTQQKYRLERWSTLANTAINLRIDTLNDLGHDELAIRHIWATAFHISVCDNVSQTHVLACMRDLKDLLESLGGPSIQLQNNAVMPEISIPAVEQELSKINMKDFFVKVFSEQQEDPVATIESLEPLLEMSLEPPRSPKEAEEANGQQANGHEILEHDAANDADSPSTLQVSEPTPLQEMSRFLANGSWSLRLSLWQRLRQAYIAIDYVPKVVSCHLRSIELILNEIKSSSFLESAQEPRVVQLLRWLHLLDQFVRKVLSLQVAKPDAFACIDSEHLKTSIDALTSLQMILYSFNVFEDHLRVGTLPSPTFEGRPKPSFNKAATWIHNIQLRVFILLYRLLQEGIEQSPEVFPNPAESRFEFLRTVHNAMGIRGMCNTANREFLHVLREELLELSDVEQSELELCQVLQDLYGLKCAPNSAEVMDHGCADVELLNRKVALKLVGFFMSQVQKVPMKDLPRTDLKAAIDKVHASLGKNKSVDDDLVLNRRVYNNYIKSTINPLDLFSSLRGSLELPTKPILPEQAELAAKGWYFLMGLISLSKFRSQKRLQAGPLEDVNNASLFFLADLEYSSERWETWYRLAQVHDLHLEEVVSWSAEKLNSQGHEIFYYQRAAIHCYAMAVTCAIRCGDKSSAASAKMAEMYAEYANRMYSSTREPFSMLAFTFREHEERMYSGHTMYKRPPFQALPLYTAWRIAAELFKRSLAKTPNNWT
jgi:hypothetical protein